MSCYTAKRDLAPDTPYLKPSPKRKGATPSKWSNSTGGCGALTVANI